MIKKLRRQFIMIAMFSVLIVLTLIIGGINIANYMNINQNLDTRLELIAANGGSFPDLNYYEIDIGLLSQNPSAGSGSSDEDSSSGDSSSGDSSSGDSSSGDNSSSPELKLHIIQRRSNFVISGDMQGNLQRYGLSEESQYATRYFTVLLDESGNILSVDTNQIAAINSQEAENYATTLFSKGKISGKGYVGQYRYLATDTTNLLGSTSTMYVFVDGGTELTTVRTFLAASIGISLAGFLIVFILVFFFSKLVVRPMAESYEKQKRFITDASHEIKTPLTIIDANTEILEMMEGENEWTESIRKQIKRLTSLTEKLVFLSRMDEENTKLEMTDFPVSDAVLDVAEGFQAVADAKHKTLELNVDPDLTYHGDEKNIRQLVSLLLDNAMKYSDDDGKIRLDFHTSGKTLLLTVWNTVDEISPGNHNELFDRFYRRDSSHNSKTGGFGIGLSVVQAIVAAHKGKITAHSDDGKSLQFDITL